MVVRKKIGRWIAFGKSRRIMYHTFSDLQPYSVGELRTANRQMCGCETGTCMRWLHFKSDGWSDTSRSENITRVKYRDMERNALKTNSETLKWGARHSWSCSNFYIAKLFIAKIFLQKKVRKRICFRKTLQKRNVDKHFRGKLCHETSK